MRSRGPRDPRERPGTGGLRRLVLAGLIASVLLGSAPCLDAETSGPTPSSEPASPEPPAPLVVHNREVFVFRASVGAVTPRDRARFFAERIDALTRKGGVVPVTLTQVPEGWQLRLGDEPLFIVRPGVIPVHPV